MMLKIWEIMKQEIWMYDKGNLRDSKDKSETLGMTLNI